MAKRKKIEAGQLEVMLAAREFLQKKHGKSVVRAMDEVDTTIPGYVSTQSLAIDSLIGNGGMPLSRVVEVFGPEGAGKSTLADHVMAEMQRLGGQAYLWDTENARDNRYVQKIGIVRQRASQIDAETMEAGFLVIQDILDWHLANYPESMGVILWDTVAGVPTIHELDPELTSEQYGPAKIIRGELRKIVQTLKKTKWLLLTVNQEYESTHNRQTVRKVYGGGGLPYFSTTRLQVSHGERIYLTETAKRDGRPPIGQVMWIKSIKNKAYPPLRSAAAAVIYGEGIDNTWTLHETLKDAGMISVSGGWHGLSWPEVEGKYPKWQGGFLGLKQLCAEHPELWALLLDAYRTVVP